MPQLKEIASGLRFPEGPVAMADGSVLVVEIAAGQTDQGTTERRQRRRCRNWWRSQWRRTRTRRQGLHLQQMAASGSPLMLARRWKACLMDIPADAFSGST